MNRKNMMGAGVLGGALLLSSAAMAAPGVATGNVHMRTGPSTRYAVITTIPAGAWVDVRGCQSWCRVSYAGRTGYVSNNYISTGYAQVRPRAYYAPAPAPRVYWNYDRYHHRDRDYWRYRHHDRWDRSPGVGFYFGFGG